MRRGHDALRRRLRGHGRLLRRRDDLRREYSVRRCVYPRRERQVLPLQRRTVRLGGAGGLRDRSLSRRDDVRVRGGQHVAVRIGQLLSERRLAAHLHVRERSNLRREHGVWTALLVRRSPEILPELRWRHVQLGARHLLRHWPQRRGGRTGRDDLRVCPRFRHPRRGVGSVAPMTPGRARAPDVGCRVTGRHPVRPRHYRPTGPPPPGILPCHRPNHHGRAGPDRSAGTSGPAGKLKIAPSRRTNRCRACRSARRRPSRTKRSVFDPYTKYSPSEENAFGVEHGDLRPREQACSPGGGAGRRDEPGPAVSHGKSVQCVSGAS